MSGENARAPADGKGQVARAVVVAVLACVLVLVYIFAKHG